MTMESIFHRCLSKQVRNLRRFAGIGFEALVVLFKHPLSCLTPGRDYSSDAGVSDTAIIC